MNHSTTRSAATHGKKVAEEVKQQREFYQSARQICGDLFTVRPWVYWVDFFLSGAAALALVVTYLAFPLTSPLAWFCGALGGLLVYRAAMFVHEIVHLPSAEMKVFRRVWNLFAGVPLLVPSFTYESHMHHHSSRHYGTEDDGEYLPLASGTIGGIFAFLAQVFFQPFLYLFRYVVWTPISFCHAGLRKWTLKNATSLVINFRYENHKRPEKQSAEDTFWELLTTSVLWLSIVLLLAGVVQLERLPKIYFLVVFVLVVNHLRTLAAHRYTSEGSTISHIDQFLDSTNVTGNWLTELFCPLGLRYHALHHLFPKIPYYNLGIAHRRLVEQLPKESLYHQTVYPNMRSAIKELIAAVRSGKSIH